jgi:pimeloyl-ACP methyl ester carboxylesterase
VNAGIETREVITVVVGGTCLRGTYHRSHDDSPSSRSGLRRTNRIGVVFVNAGFLPRASVGDSAVYWADSFAKSGYPSFRFDLPGLGDSDGDVPAKLLDFINAGGYAPILSDAVKEIIKRFSLSGVVILGHCGGATTALYTAAASKECRGLVLMDPYFFLPEERTKIREDLSHWVSWSRVGALASKIYYCLKHVRLLILRNRPPRNANLPLLRCSKQLASAGMPILILKAPALKTRGTKPRVGEFDYLGYLQESSGRNSSIVVEFIESTNHSFADVDGRSAVRQHTEQWLNAAASREAVAESAESCDRTTFG